MGNALSLFEKGFGSLIDDHDVVCRINLGINHNSPISHGTKLDVFVYSERSLILGRDIYSKGLETTKHLWTGPRLSVDDGISYYSDESEIELDRILRKYFKGGNGEMARTTTGLKALHDISESDFSEVNVFGFDWKETPTFYDMLHVNEPHDYSFEKTVCRGYFFKEKGFSFKNIIF